MAGLTALMARRWRKGKGLRRISHQQQKRNAKAAFVFSPEGKNLKNRNRERSGVKEMEGRTFHEGLGKKTSGGTLLHMREKLSSSLLTKSPKAYTAKGNRKERSACSSFEGKA